MRNIDQLTTYDSNPCGWCGTINNRHDLLYEREIEKKKRRGDSVKICEGPGWRDGDMLFFGRTFMFRCVVRRRPENPCDEEHMREIST